VIKALPAEKEEAKIQLPPQVPPPNTYLATMHLQTHPLVIGTGQMQQQQQQQQ